MTKNEISKMEFIVLSDQVAKVASQYGVAWGSTRVFDGTYASRS